MGVCFHNIFARIKIVGVLSETYALNVSLSIGILISLILHSVAKQVLKHFDVSSKLKNNAE